MNIKDRKLKLIARDNARKAWINKFKASGKTVAQVALLAGVSRASIYYIVDGSVLPTIKMLVKLNKALN